MKDLIELRERRTWHCFRYYVSDTYRNRVSLLEVHERATVGGEWRQPTRRICTTTRGNAALLQRLADALNAYNLFEQAHQNPSDDWDYDAVGSISAERKKRKAEIKAAEDAIDGYNDFILADERKDEDEQTKEGK